MVPKLNKEKCDSCSKSICFGQSITECAKCTKIVIHTKCYKKSDFKNLNSKFYCLECSRTVIPRYNPYKDLIDDCSSEEDEVTSLNCLSRILTRKNVPVVISASKVCSEIFQG